MHLIPEYREAARLQHHDWNISWNNLEDSRQRGFRPLEHAEVVVGAPATQVLARQLHRAARRLQHALRRARGLRAEMVVEGIVEQDDPLARAVAFEALPKGILQP